MSRSTQSGFTLPEMLAALLLLGLVVGTFVANYDSRVLASYDQTGYAEAQRMADLVGLAYARGYITAQKKATRKDIRRLFPDANVPMRIYKLVWTVHLDNDDPHIILDGREFRPRLNPHETYFPFTPTPANLEATP